MFKYYIFFLLILFYSCSNNDLIVISENADDKELYAAKELRKYIYQRTGELLKIEKGIKKGSGFFLRTDNTLEREEFSLKKVNETLIISGGTSQAALYGVYEYAEQMGIRFYLHGDVIPDKQIPFEIIDLNIQKKPLFSIRGIQPFHDFPEGPDWWNRADYKNVITQLPKMKMNFIGFHTYPEQANYAGQWNKAEPMVWIGTEDQINEDGTVKSAYPVLHFNTKDESWGYFSKSTSDFSFGMNQLFKHDKFGPEYTMQTSDWPHTPEENIQIFNDFGRLQNDVFEYAGDLGVKICIGTEVWLTIPLKVQEMLKDKGLNPDSDESRKMLYKGMFERIKKTHPLDYYWFWTPEHWTWNEVKSDNIAKTKNDIQLALKAGKEADVPFSFATCGWVIGPPPDRSVFDKFLPKDMPFSCINRNVGFEEIDNAFIRISGREKWAIPWMEDDPAMIVPQLWVGRMRRDAADAKAFGCNGLIGIHWRTRELGPNVSALAKAGWEQKDWNSTLGIKVNPENYSDYINEITEEQPGKRDLETADFYVDWATSQFGKEKANEIAQIYVSIDGGEKTKFNGARVTNLPRPSEWDRGPGGLLPDTTSWDVVKKEYGFLQKLEQIRGSLLGAGNIERFEYWLNEFRYLKSISRLTCIMGQYNLQLEKMKSLSKNSQKEFVESNLIPIRIKEMDALKDIHTYLVKLANSKGTLGNIANWHLHVIPVYFEKQEKDLEELLERDLVEKEMPAKNIDVEVVNFICPANSLETGDNFVVEILSMNIEDLNGKVFYKRLGDKAYRSLPIEHLSRGSFKAEIPFSEIIEDFEYYIEIKSGNTIVKTYPVTAPAIKNVVTIY